MPKKAKNIIPNTVSVLSPEAYVIDYIYLINHISEASDPVDIQGIITEFSITESLYSPGLIFQCSIKDVVNFLETYKLNGQEVIRISLQRQEPDGTYQSVKLDFYVSEYPLYAKIDQHTQVYKISAIAPHVFISELKKISRPVRNKTTQDEIKKIVETDLLSSLTIDGAAISKFTGIIPRQSPLEAVSWLLAKTYDEKFSPFFFYQTLDGKIRFSSYQNLLSAGVYNVYQDKKLVVSDDSREESSLKNRYAEKKNKILSLDSKFNVSKIFSAKFGAFASESVFIDIGKKTVKKNKFQYKKPSLSLNGNETVKLDWSYSVSRDETRPLTQTSDIYQIFFNNNGMNPTSYSNLDNGPQFGNRISIIENLEYMTHEITVPGDFDLKSGAIIEMRVIKAGDPKVIRNSQDGSYPSEIYDSMLSGRYIVTGITHTFTEEYYCRVRIKKDSPVFSLSK